MKRLEMKCNSACIVFTVTDLGVFLSHFIFLLATLTDGSETYWVLEGALTALFYRQYVVPFISIVQGDKKMTELFPLYPSQEYHIHRFPQQWSEYEHVFCDLDNLKEWRLRKGDSRWKAYFYYYFSLIVTYTSFATAVCLGSAQRLLPSKTDS